MGRHPFPLRDIALQSGLSLATVDRALHGRPGVRDNTVREVNRAIAELARQADSVRLVGKRFVIDIVMQSPARFSTAVRAAVERRLPAVYPAQVRARYHLSEEPDPGEVATTLRALRQRGTHAVILKAPDVPEVRDEVRALVAAGVPVLTLVTDIADCGRTAYIGMNNDAAGRTAAHLVATALAGRGGAVLMTLSSDSFLGEDERARGFTHAIGERLPGCQVVTVTDGLGLDRAMAARVRAALTDAPDVGAVYSIGGGNLAVLEALDATGHRPRAYVAHDLDADNIGLLRARRIDFVLHHDLDADLERAVREVLAFHDAAPMVRRETTSVIQVITPDNLTSCVAG